MFFDDFLSLERVDALLGKIVSHLIEGVRDNRVIHSKFGSDRPANLCRPDYEKPAYNIVPDVPHSLCPLRFLRVASTSSIIRDEVGFFQAIRAALIKSEPGDGKKSAAERELAIQQIVSRAVVSTEIVDIMKAAELESPDISILSDEFLAEVRETDKKNLAIEALKKLVNGTVRAQSKRNVTQAKAFSERLEAAISPYHANALTTAQVIEELIQFAKDIRAAQPRGEETGLTDEETFFMASAMNLPISGSPLAEIVPTCAISSLEVTAFECFFRSSTTALTARSTPRLRSIGFMPAATDLAPSLTIAWASTVAVVVPSPAWSEVLLATSRTI
jgi:type I restriction enzyme, R subunit